MTSSLPPPPPPKWGSPAAAAARAWRPRGSCPPSQPASASAGPCSGQPEFATRSLSRDKFKFPDRVNGSKPHWAICTIINYVSALTGADCRLLCPRSGFGIADAGKTSLGFLITPSLEETTSGVAPRFMGDIFTSSSSSLLLLLLMKVNLVSNLANGGLCLVDSTANAQTSPTSRPYSLPESHFGLLERRGNVSRSTELLGGGRGVSLRGAAVVKKHVERLALLAAAVFDAGRRGVAAKTQPLREHQRL